MNEDDDEIDSSNPSVINNGNDSAGGGQMMRDDELINADAHLITMMAKTISEINNRIAATHETTPTTNTANESAVAITFMEALELTAPPEIIADASGAINVNRPSPVRRTSAGTVARAGLDAQSQAQQQQQQVKHQTMKKKSNKKMCQANSTFYVPVNESDGEEGDADD